MKKIDLAGQMFDRLTVMQESGKDTRGETLWMCKCECGNIVNVLSSNLRTGHTKSCGCRRSDKGVGNYKHGMYGTSIYEVWSAMIQRCTNEGHAYYYRYGGRGIKVCVRWLKFENFYKDMGDKPDGFTLERINNNGDYCKDNCKWVTVKEQTHNRETTVNITFNGKTQCVAAWEDELGFKHGTLWMRIYKYNWPVEKAMTEPLKDVKRVPITVFGKTQSLTKHAKDHGLGLTTVQQRLSSGLSIEEALTTPLKIVKGRIKTR